MKIYIVRHGESLATLDRTMFGKMDPVKIPLTEWGWKQAKEAGEAIKEHRSEQGETKKLNVRISLR